LLEERPAHTAKPLYHYKFMVRIRCSAALIPASQPDAEPGPGDRWLEQRIEAPEVARGGIAQGDDDNPYR